MSSIRRVHTLKEITKRLFDKKAKFKRKKTPTDLIAIRDAHDYIFHRTSDDTLKYDSQSKYDDSFAIDTSSEYIPIDIPNQDEVPTLKHKLTRVLFSPGVHYLQDPRTKVFNFDPSLQKIPTIQEFNFNKITKYITSSKDELLSYLASKNNLKYYSSTSSMTGVLTHFHFLLSNFRPSSFLDITRHHKEPYGTFTKSVKMAASTIVKRQKNGTYSIDSDKSTDQEIILSLLGHSLERFLTHTPEEFKKYITPHSECEEKIVESNTYHYAKMDDFLMRSQLDCKDNRLPGTGTFDLKTRAVNAVRYDIPKVTQDSTGYQILKTFGSFESFEREQVDLARSTLIKYGLQARIGNMDGIFVAYHNTVRMFGFEYLPLDKIDEIIHSFGMPELDINIDRRALASKLANDEFKLSMNLWNKILNSSIEKQPETSFRMIVKTRKNSNFDSIMRIIISPINEEEIKKIENIGSSLADNVESHIESIQKLNDELCHDPLGYDLIIKNKINGSDSFKRHPVITDVNYKWEVEAKLVRLKDEVAKQSYNDYLGERTSILRKSIDSDGDDLFVKTLRAYGLKGEKLQELEEYSSKEVIWNNE